MGWKNKLAVYCDLMDIHVPEKYGKNVAAKGIKAMRAAIGTYGSYSQITADGKPAKDAWKAVLGHNRLDCRNAREVVTRAAEESAEIERPDLPLPRSTASRSLCTSDSRAAI